ncbi:Pkr1p [Sporobolomyces salmoneus]|uniref:Pkr1p n=1 Tax=Sporobolomyces salmoneus TaxID=183962 RepID=UPI00316EDFB8
MASSTTSSGGMLSDVVSSIFTPGTNSGLIQAMSYSFYALFVTLFGMVLLTGGNLHVVALLALSIGLFVSIKWFLIQIKEVEEQQRIEREKKEKENPDGVAATSTVADSSKGKTE